jgi:quercetin dioxygenase-like cupin family protein
VRQPPGPDKMTDRVPGQKRPPGQTSATTERLAQQVQGAVLSFDLIEEIAALRAENAWQRGDHNTKTLVKEADLRLVLVALKCGARLPVHETPTRITLQTVEGSLRVTLPEQTIDLPAQRMLVLAGNVARGIQALEDSVLLLALSWSDTATARAEPLD